MLNITNYRELIKEVEELMESEAFVSDIHASLYPSYPPEAINKAIKTIYSTSPQNFEMCEVHGNVYYKKGKKKQ